MKRADLLSPAKCESQYSSCESLADLNHLTELNFSFDAITGVQSFQLTDRQSQPDEQSRRKPASNGQINNGNHSSSSQSLTNLENLVEPQPAGENQPEYDCQIQTGNVGKYFTNAVRNSSFASESKQLTFDDLESSMSSRFPLNTSHRSFKQSLLDAVKKSNHKLAQRSKRKIKHIEQPVHSVKILTS